jgi:hypothetical protein
METNKSAIVMFNWNQPMTINPGVYYQYHLGSLELILYSEAGALHVYHRYSQNEAESLSDVLTFKPLKKLPKRDYQSSRIMGFSEQRPLVFRPRLADRALVAKPHQPLLLPCNQQVTIYISSPVWLSVWQEGEKLPLFEVASYLLSDTWYGPRPHLGVLCYASRFSGRTQLEALPRRASRIITPVTIRNQSDEHLKIEKVAIPTEILAVYGRELDLWTHGVRVTKHKDAKLTAVEVDKKLHESLTDMILMAEPRVKDTDNLISKTFARIFS